MNNSKSSHLLKIEDRVRDCADQLETLLERAPQQQCRPESAWNEGDDFTERFNDIWGEVVGLTLD
jgi:hypothetical protein